MLNWLQRFDTFCFLDNNSYPEGFDGCIAAAGVRREAGYSPGAGLALLEAFMARGNKWVFGHLGYDLRVETEGGQPRHPDPVGFPLLYFFEPAVVIQLKEELVITATDPDGVFREIDSCSATLPSTVGECALQPALDRQTYIGIIEKLKYHIQRGDCYEINFCQEFFDREARISPLAVFARLQEISPNPFSALYRLRDRWLICASPERFLKKEGERLLSQPMKGTSARNAAHPEEDQALREALYRSEKDRSENVMVVDLVRNDLSRVCRPGTVQVDELFGIRSYPSVHQMVSTVSGKLKEATPFPDIIRACFPMGSMTGAPKRRVTELIDQYELTSRGLFSGSVGYIDPEGNFDFNVVIRSILYNAASGYLSLQAGSGITFYSDPEKEWEECLLKAAAMRRVLQSNV